MSCVFDEEKIFFDEPFGDISPQSYLISKTGNPIEFLGKRNDLTPKNITEIAKKFKKKGATILGGCCETSPLHIQEMAKLK